MVATLQLRHYRNGEHIMRARDCSKGRRTMLMIDHYVPEPDRDAGSRTILEVDKEFAARWLDHQVLAQNLRYDPIYTTKLQQMGVENAIHPWVNSFDDWLIGERRATWMLSSSAARQSLQDYLGSLKRILPKSTNDFLWS